MELKKWTVIHAQVVVINIAAIAEERVKKVSRFREQDRFGSIQIMAAITVMRLIMKQEVLVATHAVGVDEQDVIPVVEVEK